MNLDENFGRKRSSTEDHQIQQTFSAPGKRLRIISEASLATALNDEEEELEDEVQTVRVSKRNESHLQPKTEALEFLDEAAQSIQQTNQQTIKQTQSITYMNMDSFTEKTATVATNQPQTTVTTRENFWKLFFEK